MLKSFWEAVISNRDSESSSLFYKEDNLNTDIHDWIFSW
jgi:hypothetical protein